MAKNTKICDVDQIEDGGSDGFVIDTKNGRCGLMVLRRGERVVSYLNSCPHVGTPLDIQPGRFLSQSGTHILCTTHGALFQINDGLCVAGPCLNDRLTPVDVEVRDGGIYLEKDALPTLWPPIGSNSLVDP